VVLERVTERQARIDAELEAARAIQTKLMPREVSVPGFEVVAHMRPAESVGGDYFDVHSSADGSWFFLGDVTGHGLGAGLVTLMAQSTVSSILAVRPDVRPAQLNYLANRILAANLVRLEEQRHITFVAVRCVGPDSFVVSGSHDTAFVYRAGSRTIEPFPLEDFPFGLGMLGDLDADAFNEGALSLHVGDVLFVGSDGITEAARAGNVRDGMFGEAALTTFLQQHATRPLRDIKGALIDRLDEYTAGVYHDDVSFVMVRAL
jgi:serine phosphatase RsbU (regulator of sigma subunit)